MYVRIYVYERTRTQANTSAEERNEMEDRFYACLEIIAENII